MAKIKFHIILFSLLILGISSNGFASSYKAIFQQIQTTEDSTKKDSVKVEKYEPSFRSTFEQHDRFGDPFTNSESPSPLLLHDPANLTLDLEIDTAMNYTIYERIGSLNYRPRTTMSFDQFIKFQEERSNKEYFQSRSAGLDGESAVSARRLIPKLYISPVFDRIFGGNYVDIQPTGFVNLDFGGRWQTVENPAVPINQQRNGGFNYNQQISMNVVGKVGEKLSVTANFDNNNTFDYQNNLKIEYTGYEEDIIKKIEIGNVSMPVANSLISGGQSLFGVKTELQFGKLFVTGLASRQQGTAKTQSFNQNSDDINDITGIKVTEYDEYKHFFLGHFFRDNYNQWLSGLPQVRSSVLIQNIQVYVVKNQGNNQTVARRAVVALSDLGEFKEENIGNDVVIPVGNAEQTSNDANNLFDGIVDAPQIRSVEEAPNYLKALGLQDNTDFAVRDNVRKLEPSEYLVRNNLGYITLRSPLNEGEVLAVSFEYSHNGVRYQVGELSNSNQDASQDQTLILKLLKPTRQNLDKPIWDLAMKNIYTLSGARGLSENDFKLQIVYDDNTTNYRAPNLNEGTNTNNIPLLQVLKLDQLNNNQDPFPDAKFDFIEGVTFDPDYGAVIFPVIEPFGQTLEEAFTDGEQNLKDKYVFNELYDDTKTNARQVSLKNKFELVPEFQGRAQTEYLLDGFSILEGSVVVTSGSQVLNEGTDYTVSYLGGTRVTLSPEIANAGNQINITYEEADVFSFSSKWLTGARLDYQFNEKVNVGATVMHLNERTQGISRYSIGNEPVNNTKYGFDVNFQEDSRMLTKIIDALPLISTKETSTVTFNGEFAQLISGTSNKVNGESTGYIDDFESAATTYSLGGGNLGWKIGATPTGNPEENFDESVVSGNPLGLGYKRAKMAWYTIDPGFYVPGGNRPANITDEDLTNPYVKRVLPQDILNVDPQVVNNNLPVFDLAYFPSERGVYNYNNRPTDFQANGLFRSTVVPDNFGAITREVPTNFDFTRNNVEYIEFWLMDPFLDDPVLDGVFNQPNSTGGELVFNLGEVSEDVLEDNVHAFENGLPPDGSDAGTRTTDWGRVTTQNYLTQFFDASAAARANQDVGLDGYNSAREQDFFEDQMDSLFDSGVLDEAVVNQLKDDLSQDDFRFYLDQEYDQNNSKIIERYKEYNGLENNSPAGSGGSFSSSATNLPDNEDLNEDNFVSQEESYFEYRIPLQKGQLENSKYFIDKKQDLQGQATWYLFRVPIQEPTTAINNPQFNFLRYMRMYMTGWQQPVVLRMANFQMVSSQWRKFTDDLSDDGFGTVPEPAESDFELSVVNYEQNNASSSGKPPYVLPPGIERDYDNSSAYTRQINEQSLKLCVTDLKDGDARGAFKTPVSVDLVNYGTLKMFFHAESVADEMLLDGDVSAFLRLARDETENYYEIELPLVITPDQVTGTPDEIRRAVWPLENEINIALNELYTLKSARNAAQDDVTVAYSQPSSDGKYKLTVKGNPKLSDIQYLMIGVKNPKTDDRSTHSTCIWANELRVADFNSNNGWAANARMNVKLADFATLNGSTKYTSFGFGGIQDRINERSMEENMQYDVSATVNVDKLIPGKTGIKLPMFVSFSEATQTPKFDPLDSDIPLDASLDKFNTPEEREDYEQKVISHQTSKSINFMDVHKEKVKEGAKQHIYDLENLSFSYSYSEDKSSNQNVAENLRKKYFGSASYIYSPKPPSLEPFKSAKGLSSPWLKLIKDINLSPFPNNISVRASIDRNFSRSQLRNADLTTDGIAPNYEKLFYFDRNYNVRWNIFKSVGINYNATVHAIIDEAEGDINTRAEREEIWDNIKSGGRTKTFKQTVGLNYRLPLDKLPLTDWISADYRFAVDYNWRGTNINQVAEFGNIIDNARTQDLNAKFDLVKLYNKSKMLSEINKPPRVNPRAPIDTTRQSSGPIFKGLMRLIMSIRSVNATFSKRQSTELPGMLNSPYLFGMDSDWSSPGWGFVFGSQDPEVRYRAALNGWLTDSLTQTSSFIQQLTEELNIKTTVEPFKDFRIQVDMRRTNISSYQEIYRNTNGNFDDPNYEPNFESLTPTRTGSYTITFLPIATSFQIDDALNNSDAFEEFVANRDVIRQRLNNIATGGEYGANSQDVLIPSFIAAYNGESAQSVRLTPFPTFPMPNWRVDYAGLSKVGNLPNVFSSINLTHAYTATFSITNYINSSLYQDANSLDLSNNILDYQIATEPGQDGTLTPKYTINQVAISERFSPLIGINMRTKSNISIKIDYSRERNLLLDLTNSQITELRSGDVTFDLGISKNEWKLPFKIRGRTSVIKNNIQFRLAFTVRDTKTLQRKIDELSLITDGNINYQLRPQISYVANQKLNITMYYERTINEPKISSSFNRSATAFGVQLRFSLSQ